VAPKNVICVVVDRLHAGMIGAYGNSWIRTTALDKLAAESFLFDQALLDCPQLAKLYRAYWLGLHALGKQSPSGASFPRLLSEAGMHTALVTDEAEVADLASAADFAERVLVESPPKVQTAGDVSQTAIARVFETATLWLQSARQPFCLWVHARGMGTAWDAPLAMRDRFADEDDPRPPTFAAVPDYWLPDEFDPDEVLGVKHAYAGQVAALDRCAGAFCDAFAQSALADNTQLTFLSARGFPLGEHRRVGPCDDALYNETVQLVWLMRFPDERGKLARSQALVQPADLPGTLVEWLGLDRGRLGSGHATSLLRLIDGEVDALGDRAAMVSLHDRAIRTPGWHLREPVAGAAELYAKPGDRWEVNEVANLAGEIVAGLQAALAEIVASGCVDQLPPLAEPLATAVD
jgi:arylsulfatase A-like enzyme